MKFLLSLIVILCFGTTFSQKIILDTSAVKNWPTVSDGKISNDGEFISYRINNQPVGENTLVIKSIDDHVFKNIIGASGETFSEDSKWCVFKKGGDSLYFFNTKYNTTYLVPKVQQVLYPKNNKNFIAYNKKETDELYLRDLLTNQEKRFEGVSRYAFDNDGKYLLLQKKSNNDDSAVVLLEIVSLLDMQSKKIWAGKKLGVFVFDDLSSQVAFCGIDRNEEEEENFSIFYFKIGTQKPIKISNNVKNINRDNLLISKDFLRFSENGQYVFFNKKRKATILKGNLIQGVDVWSYNDKYLQSEQGSNMYSGDAKSQFKCVLNLQNFGVTQLEDEQTSVQLKANNRFVLAFRIPMYYDYYDNHDTASLFLISLSDGKRTVLAKGQGNFDATLSPKENSVVWFDLDSLAYFAYDIISGHTRNISNDIPFPTYDPEAKKIGRSTPFGLPFTALSSRWVDDNRSILIYDQYDIWMVDLQGIKQAINITNGFGRKNEIAFGIVDRDLSNHELAISDKSEILLAGFEIATKRNGFWSARIGKSKNPILKSMQDYTYYVPRTGNGYQIDVFQSYGVYPQKAKNADRWLVQRMNSAVSANLFLTSDFQHFQPLSDIKPEKNYVWLTSELVSWTQSNGQILHGILYKPDNFDSSKRYPLIFNYYARRSNELNEFIKPDFSRHNINIPFFVSNGYLVFVPDIYYQSGHNGVGVMNSIVSARNNLIKLPWIDSMKIGLDGHSFGGWETNFIITHCNLFAAASEAAGVSDQISAYGQLNFGTGQQRQEFYETWSQGSSYGVGVTPWTRTDLYLENSPITKIDKVVTPLLMMHCKNDLSVPFEQAIEMFLGMRRAGKKVWLLQYDNDGHVLYNDENAKDYTIRLLQFFDYYLKGCPAPVWMTKGVPMSSKGKNKGFEYDTSRDVP